MMRKQISKKKLERLTMQGGDYRKAGRREGQQQVSLLELRALLEDDVKNLHRREKDTSSTSSGSDSARKRKAAEDCDGGADSVPAVDWIQRDISDAELDLIMNRDRLFPTSKKALSTHSLLAGTASQGVKSKGSCASLVSSVDGATSVETAAEIESAVPKWARGSGGGSGSKKKVSAAKGTAATGAAAGTSGAPEEEDDVVVLDYDEYAAASACKSPGPRAAATSAGTPGAPVDSGVPAAADAPDALDAATVAAWEAERERLDLALDLPLEGEMYDLVTDSTKGNHQLLSIK